MKMSKFFSYLALLLSLAATSRAAVETQPDGADAAAPRFDIWEYRVDGNTLLDTAVIEERVYGFLGPDRDFAAIEGARDALQSAYHQAGYTQVEVYIPPQDQVDIGVVTLAVSEPRIERLRVSGARYFLPSDIRASAPALSEGRAINEGQVAADLAELNTRNPDLKVIPVLRPGVTPGTVEAELKVQDELPLHGQVELNNEGSTDTTDTRLSVNLSYGNLWQRDHKLTLLGFVTPEDIEEVRVLSANYLMPLPDSDNKLLLYLLRSDSDVTTVGNLTVVGRTNILGGSLIVPLDLRGDLSHNLLLGVEYRDVENDELLTTNDIQFLTTSARWLGQYRHGANGATDFSVGLVAGFEGLVNDQQQFEQERMGAEPAFVAFDWSLEHNRSLDELGVVTARVRGQLTPEPLISSLQFAAGGARSVRGYYEAQELADNGVAATVEWRSVDLWPRLRGADSEGPQPSLHLLAFSDAAWLWNKTPLPADVEDTNIWSAGVGARFLALDEVYVDLDVAWPFRTLGPVEKGDPRAHVRLGYRF